MLLSVFWGMPVAFMSSAPSCARPFYQMWQCLVSFISIRFLVNWCKAECMRTGTEPKLAHPSEDAKAKEAFLAAAKKALAIKNMAETKKTKRGCQGCCRRSDHWCCCPCC